MKVWRLTSRRYAEHAFDGEGARLYGGRFNHSGTAIVYCSESLSLAVLEMLVHLESQQAPTDWVAIPALVPAELPIRELNAEELPEGWRRYPAPEALKTLGSDWADAGEAVALSVPSVVIPHERNLLLNPLHPDMKRVEVGSPEPFVLDPRLW